MKSITIYAVGLLWLLSCGQAYAYESSGRAMKGQHFTENKGQITDQYLVPRNDIDFKLSAGNGLNVFIGKGHISYQWAKPQATTTDAESGLEHTTYELYRMDVVLLGANKEARIQPEEKQPGYERYFQPWVNTYNSNYGGKAHHYSRITYRDVYPHIDWVFYFNDNGQLEHDFVVRPGGKVSDIKMQYRGADKVALTANGSLSATTTMGTITEQAPIAHDATGRRVPVRFVLTKDVLQFDVSAYSGTLTIDPVVEWGTYFGGAANDAGMDLATDKWGYVYLCGSTNSVGNIATTGAHQVSFGGAGNDAFLSKWNSQGELLWATYYGGTNIDIARGVSCDSLGNVYIGGNTNSNYGVATPGSFQDTFTAFAHDAFIVKFDSAGIRLWGTYFGGFSNNDANTSFGICVDNENNVCVTGNTQSTDFPVTIGAHQPIPGGGQDAFIAKFNPNGLLVWSTYYGGSAGDFGVSIATDESANIFITGYSQSTSGIATVASHQPNCGGGQDAFLAKFGPSGVRVWATYIGGSSTDRSMCIAVKQNLLVVGGLTNSTNGIATSTSHQDTKRDGDDGFVCVFDLAGQLQWATYVGTEGQDAIEGVLLSELNEIYVTGAATGDTGITTPGSIQELFAGSRDLFLVKFDGSGTQQWGTYYGGADADAIGVAAYFDRNIYMAGRTNSGSGIATSGGIQQMLGGGTDGFLVRIDDCPTPSMTGEIIGPQYLCGNVEGVYSIVPNGPDETYWWILPAGWAGYSDSSSIAVIPSDNSGSIKVFSVNACGGIGDTLVLSVIVSPSPAPTIIADGLILSCSQSFSTYQWQFNGVNIPGATSPTHIASENGFYTLQVLNGDSCLGLSNVIEITGVVHINQVPDGSTFQLFPNPVSQTLYINTQTEGLAVLSSLDGRVVLSANLQSNSTQSLPVSSLPAGVYWVKLYTKMGVSVHKLVKV